MNPSVWGPKMWFSLHTITLNYPKKPTYKIKKLYNNFFVNLQYMLPCSNCCSNYKKHLEKYPLKDSLNCKKDLVLWLINIHNEVNKQLDKPIMKPNDALNKLYDEYKKHKLKKKLKCNIEKYNWVYIGITIAIILLLIIIYVIMKKRRRRNMMYMTGGYRNYNFPKNNIYYGNRF